MRKGQLLLEVDLRLGALLLVREGGLLVGVRQVPGELDHGGQVEGLRQQMLMLGGNKDGEDVSRSCPAFSLPLSDSSTV